MPISFESRKPMTVRMVYVGPRVNLSRFGQVNSGDVLMMDSVEAAYVKDDKRFIHWPDGAQKPGAEPKATQDAASPANKNTPATPPGKK